jgi:VWFA-related protein
VGGLAAASLSFAQQSELPRFTTSVELTPIDVSVVDDRGKPIADLTSADFSVRIDGAERRVVSAEWIQLDAPAGAPPPAIPDGFSSNESATNGRLTVLVVDQPNIRFGGTMGIRKAMHAFIDQLEPSDRTAVLGVGPAAPSTPFTNDGARLKKAVDRMVGTHTPGQIYAYNVSISESLDIYHDVPGALEQVVFRECRDFAGASLVGPERDICINELRLQARDAAMTSTNDGRDTMDTLRAVFRALRSIDAPKTLLLVTEGFVIGNDQSLVLELGALSAAARTSIYALKLDDSLMQLAASEQHLSLTPMRDRQARTEGLDLLVGSSRGTLFNVMGNGAGVFERLRAEMSGYYLLGVESGPTDRDGKAHPIRVNVSRRGANVRARRALLTLKEQVKPPTPRERMLAALANPLPLSALPLRVATYSLQGPESGKVQLLIHADVGRDYSSSRNVSLGYVITDSDGRAVESQIASARLPPIMNGVPSALQFSGGASLPPGEYFLKLAVVEGDRIGSIEHPIRAGVQAAGEVRVSDLMVGGPVNIGLELLRPTIGYSIVFGAVHGYLEAYGAGAESLKAKYEIAASEEGDAIIESEVLPRMAGGSRAIFTHVLPARQLPPGKYVLRARLSSPSQTVRVATRPFEVGAPAVLMTSASVPNTSLVARDVFLPVSEQALSQEFDPASAARPATVQAFRDRVPAASRAAFDRGVQALASGAYSDAETSFKSVINPDQESGAVIAYLAAVFAAAGRDDEASGAWQTALIEGSEIPELYEWLAGAQMRNRDLGLARGTLEEAIAKWPSDTRFAKPMAIVYAAFGQGQQAVRLLTRHLAEHKNDVESLLMGIEWLYQLRVSGVAAQSPAEDRKLAKSYAEAYAKAKGPQMALVRQWVEFIDKK